MSRAPRGLDGLDLISLAEMERTVPLRVRADHKHLVDVASLDALLQRLAPTHRALEIDGRRAFAYDTVYFDTGDLLTARAHVQRRRRRFKCRSRLYVDTDTCAFEVKVKGPRGETIKHRLPYEPPTTGSSQEPPARSSRSTSTRCPACAPSCGPRTRASPSP